ncbi:nuclear transport factor 2 family protein [Streptomyces niveus]|uniref:nuclear transport factor 2 family protein n=1 Tax=Streptomyces niveus TaxID=193462 RepID=UPI00084C4EEE|nr:nuclear transport factor 2 family protein [Streptomyces niveus]
MPAPATPLPEDLRDVHRAYLDAMREGDTQALDDLLGEDYTLTHMTGYVQPKAEWLAQMRQDRFVYHSITEQDITWEIEGDRTARLTVRTVTDATVYGTRSDWRLLLSTDHTRHDGVWCRRGPLPPRGEPAA